MGARYDALLWFEQTKDLCTLHHEALRPLHHEARPREQEHETEPTGF